MPDKLTDSEIVKALKEILEIMLTMGDLQKSSTISKAIDLINRLQAEKEEKQKVIDSFTDIGKLYSEIKAEAYKECIEKVKEEINKHSYGVLHKIVINYKIDNLLKELVGGDIG